MLLVNTIAVINETKVGFIIRFLIILEASKYNLLRVTNHHHYIMNYIRTVNSINFPTGNFTCSTGILKSSLRTEGTNVEIFITFNL